MRGVEYQYIAVKVEEPVGYIILRRTEKLNALNTAMLNEILRALDELIGRREAKVVAIRGEGRFFSAGVDLTEVAEAETPDDAAKPFTTLAAVVRRLLDYDKPVLLGLNGDAYAGGAELVWAADMVAAVRTAKLVWTEPRWALIPPLFTTLAPLVIGIHRAFHLAVTATPLTAEEAHQLGIITTLVDTVDDLNAALRTLAERIIENEPNAVISLRKLLRLYFRPILEHGLAELERMARSKAFMEAARAFKAKQRPRYEW